MNGSLTRALLVGTIASLATFVTIGGCDYGGTYTPGEDDDGYVIESTDGEAVNARVESALTTAKLAVIKQAQPGDILVSRGATCDWTLAGNGYWCHAALVSSAYPGFKTIEIGGPGKSVVETNSLTYYSGDSIRVGLVRVKAASATQRSASVRWARSQIGTPYSYTVSKTNLKSTYCALVPWRAYKMMSIDLDSDGGYWVLPDNIFVDGDVSILSVAQ